MERESKMVTNIHEITSILTDVVLTKSGSKRSWFARSMFEEIEVGQFYEITETFINQGGSKHVQR